MITGTSLIEQKVWSETYNIFSYYRGESASSYSALLIVKDLRSLVKKADMIFLNIPHASFVTIGLKKASNCKHSNFGPLTSIFL